MTAIDIVELYILPRWIGSPSPTSRDDTLAGDADGDVLLPGRSRSVDRELAVVARLARPARPRRPVPVTVAAPGAGPALGRRPQARVVVVAARRTRLPVVAGARRAEEALGARRHQVAKQAVPERQHDTPVWWRGDKTGNRQSKDSEKLKNSKIIVLKNGERMKNNKIIAQNKRKKQWKVQKQQNNITK